MYENPVFYMNSVIVYEKYRLVCMNFVRLVEFAVIMCAATVGWRNLRVAGRSAGGSGGVVGQKNTARASSSPTCALEDA